MGVVYEAFDDERGARVALKTIRSLTGESLARFKHEFRALADMHHPNLVMLGELISEGAQWFFSMELVEGEDFLAYVRPTLEPDLGAAKTLTPSQAAGEALARLSSHVRAARSHAGALDLPSLRRVLPQVAAGIAALHRAGMVHRDIKPSNIRVTPQGRAVLLDFGLVIEVDGAPISQRGALSGTPEYMAPEQVSAESVGPAVDWYALGVLLYEALTGTLPFVGTPLEIVMKKVSYEPPPASSIARGVPPDLDALAMGLLRYDPTTRLSGDQVLAALGVAISHTSSGSSGAGLPFVGREQQEAELRDAFLAAREGLPVSVLVDGESGVGKSCLVRHFVDELRDASADVLLLQGRCYEREEVPYRGFDGVVDALANFLAHERPLAQRLVPRSPAPLLQVFPVLRRVDALAQGAGGPMPAVDPVEIRRRAFLALREVLALLSKERPLVVTIDDLQWANADSLALLAEILRPESRAQDQAPAVLVIATMRPTATTDAAALKEMVAGLPGEVRRMTLGPLDPLDARELASKLLARSAPGTSNAEVIAREASGHPLFIDALVQHAALRLGEGPGRLEDALWFRVSSLEPLPRALVEMLAVSSAPMPQEVLASAAEASPEAFAKSVSLLRVAHLVLTTGAKNTDTIEAYHDRLRAAVVLHVDEDTQRARHRAIARAFERTAARAPEALALHWEAAGDPERAARYVVAAADAAAAALAFDRAASLYEKALRLHVYADVERRALYEKLGDALANAGRGWPSAAAYTEAARGAAAAHALELRRRAAEQLLRTGHIEAGLAAVRSVLLATGLGYPRTPFAALAVFVLIRVWLRLRGLGFVRRDASQVTQAELTRIDICGAVASSLSAVDTVRAATFQARHLLLTLRAGEPVRVARALASEVGYVSRAGVKAFPRVESIGQSALALAEESGDAPTTGWALCTLSLAYYMHGRYTAALARADRGIELLQTRCTGVTFEITFARSTALWALAHLGRLRELRRRQAGYLRAARERGDVYGVVNLSAGDSALGWLADDAPALARRETDLAMGQWPRHEFLVEHFFELVARTHVDLYDGHAAEAYARVKESWGALQRSLIPLTVHWVRIQAWHFRARASLAFARSSEGGKRDALLARAAKDARKIAREKTVQGAPMAQSIEASIAAQRGQKGRAVALLREALAGFEVAEMALYAALARRVLGELLSGAEGLDLVRASDEWMRAEEVKAPARMAATLLPGFADG